VTPTVTKVAAGAIEHLAMAIVPGVPGALLRMTDAGVTAIGLDASADMSLFAVADVHGAADIAGPLALVIGAEGRGLAPLTRKRCTALVSIPQNGTIESLNVAAAGAVAFFEVARARAGRAPATPNA
jgi:23S rRNA (guanosine2251-2'-O)-methyltransferase